LTTIHVSTDRFTSSEASSARLAPLTSTEGRIEGYLRSLGITQPARSFITAVSNLYHGFESENFDERHPEIAETMDRWRDCLDQIGPNLRPSIRVLDVGAGTGFASAQVLESLGSRVSEIVCYDLSPDMLRKCRARIQPLVPRAHFVSGQAECLAGGAGKFDLVVTSAMLHHQIDVDALFDVIRPLVRVGGFYLAAHEPSRLYYSNAWVNRWTNLYRVWRRLRRAASPESYRRLVSARPPAQSLEQRTNQALVDKGFIRQPLPPGVITQLVDIHVPHPSPKVPFWGQRGFDPYALCQQGLKGFDVVYCVTYSHLREARARLGLGWLAIDRTLARKYPNAGSNFLMAARRVS